MAEGMRGIKVSPEGSQFFHGYAEKWGNYGPGTEGLFI